MPAQLGLVKKKQGFMEDVLDFITPAPKKKPEVKVATVEPKKQGPMGPIIKHRKDLEKSLKY